MTDVTIFSVSGGKFHVMAAPFDRKRAWHTTLTACGAEPVPVNYFEDVAAVDSYTGGRSAEYMCKRCLGKGAAQ